MREGFRSRFFATFIVLITLNTPLGAEPARFTDFEWRNRLLIVCDLQRPAFASDWTTYLGQIMLADRENSRRIRIGLLGFDNWVLYGPSASHSDRIIPLVGDGCETDDCRDKFYHPDNRTMIKRLGCTPENETFALIGLDGGVKKIWREAAPDTEEVFALIDAMPMRARELAAQPSRN